MQTREFSKYLLCVMGRSMRRVNAYAAATDANRNSSNSTQEVPVPH